MQLSTIHRQTAFIPRHLSGCAAPPQDRIRQTMTPLSDSRVVSQSIVSAA